MTRDWNLPPGVTMADIEGPPMPHCTVCGGEHNEADELCEVCEARIREEEEASD